MIFDKKMAFPPRLGRNFEQPEEGFTLLEIVIVLVIVGLVVGGVLVGQELIKSADVRAQLKQIDEYSTAINAFHDKYDCLPGDCRNADKFGLNPPADPTFQGNGDGVIGFCDEPFPAPCNINLRAGPALDSAAWNVRARETYNMWPHMSNAGLIAAVTFAPQPKLKPDDITPNFSLSPDGVISTVGSMSFGSGSRIDGPALMIVSLPDAVALSEGVYTGRTSYRLDAKIDDGVPDAGTVRAFTVLRDGWLAGSLVGYMDGRIVGVYYTHSAPPPSGTPDACLILGPPMKYNTLQSVTGHSKGCNMVFQASW